MNMEKHIGMPVFMDDVAAAGKAEHVKMGIKNCAKMEREKKISYGLKKSKYMIVKTGKEAYRMLQVGGTEFCVSYQPSNVQSNNERFCKNRQIVF